MKKYITEKNKNEYFIPFHISKSSLFSAYFFIYKFIREKWIINTFIVFIGMAIKVVVKIIENKLKNKTINRNKKNLFQSEVLIEE